MTVLAAIQTDRCSYIATDARRTSGWHNVKDDAVKIHEKSGFIFAGTGMALGVQAIQNHWSAPSRDYKQGVDDFIVSKIGASLLDCLKNNNCAITKDGRTLAQTEFIFSYAGQLFEFGCCGLIQKINEYSAHGSGMEFALGSLYSTNHYDIPPEERLNLAIGAASFHSAFCGGEVNIIKQERE